jgi:hypothetical protein
MFKKSFFMLFLVLAYSSLMMSMEKPYEPSFSAKHPIIIRTLKSLTAGLGAAGLTYKASNYLQGRNTVRNSLVAGAAVVAGVWICDTLVKAFKKPRLDIIYSDENKALTFSRNDKKLTLWTKK